MLLSYFQTGLIWYYLNVLIIALIIFMVLKIAYARANRVIVNRSESESKEDRLFIKFVMFISLFGLVFFFLREYAQDIIKGYNYISERITEWYNGK